MLFLKIIFGLFLLVVAWGYFFKKQLIFKLNSLMRDFVFNDQVVLFSGRRVALLLMVLAGISLFSGLENSRKRDPFPKEVAEQMLGQARIDFSQKKYANVIKRCKSLVKADPKYVDAWVLMVETWSRMGEKDLAHEGANILLRLDPHNSLAQAVLKNERERIVKENK